MLGCLAREQLEAALCVADMTDADDAEDGMQAIHEYVADQRTLYRIERHRNEQGENARTFTTASVLTR